MVGWKKERNKLYKEMKEANQDQYIQVEKQALYRMYDFLESEKSNITNTREFSEFASAIAKLLKPHETNIGNKTQINITQNNLKPLSIEEARKKILEDPINVEVEEATIEE